VRFTAGYVSAPVCCPSRAGLMTGRYQQRYGHELNAIGPQNLLPNVGLPLSELTLADRLKSAGYATGMVGKWHLGGTEPYHPMRRGFGSFFGFLHEGHFYVDGTHAKAVSLLREKEPPYDDRNPILRGTEPAENPGYLTRTFTREAVAFIDRHHDRPFFLYLPYNAVHSPMQAAETDLARFGSIGDRKRAIFASMLAALDDGVGDVLDALRRHGLEEQTLVMFLSDNGGPTEELTSRNLPFRGGKGQLYEGGIRIPFLIQWKGRIPAGTVDDRPVISLDLVPTALAAASAGPPGPPALDGVNLLPYLEPGKTEAPHDRLGWRYGAWAALREGRWKLVRPRRDADWQLYDLENDPAESRDLAREKPEERKRLVAAWEAWNAPMVEPLWGGRRR
jgi:arylsulfatase B